MRFCLRSIRKNERVLRSDVRGMDDMRHLCTICCASGGGIQWPLVQEWLRKYGYSGSESANRMT